MRTLIFSACLAIPFAVSGQDASAQSRGIVSLEEAERVCLRRASRFATSGFGGDSGQPPPDLIRHKFNTCVYGKSKQNPRSKLRVRGSRLSLSG